jgi:hypothetical protein
MDPVTLILSALVAGAAVGGQSVAGDAIKEAYAGLKALIERKFAGKPSAEVALTGHENDPKTWEAPLKKALVQEHIDQDLEVIKTAQRVLQLVQPQQAAMSTYDVQVTGNIQGFAQGAGQTVTMDFGSEPNGK